MFLGQGFQHLFVALSAADLLSAPTIKSRFVSIDSGHSYSPACKRCTNESSNCCKGSLVGRSGTEGTHSQKLSGQHGARLSKEFLNREGATCCSGCLRGQDLKYTLHWQIAVSFAESSLSRCFAIKTVVQSMSMRSIRACVMACVVAAALNVASQTAKISDPALVTPG